MEPMKNIMRLEDYGYGYDFRVECICTDGDHAHTINISKDPDTDMVNVHLYTTRRYGGNRFKGIIKLLLGMDIEMDTDILMDAETARNYGQLLIDKSKEIENE